MSLKTFFFGDNKYGFINKNIKPDKTLVNNQMKFVTTSDFNHCAKNHCAATLLTNLCIFYAHKGYKQLIDKDINNTFKEIHDLVGDGPVMILSKKARKYFYLHNYNLVINKLNSLEDIKKSIDDGIPCALLLENALFNWHWVLVVGYKDNYLEIIDNWNRSTRYYLINNGSRLRSAKAYKIV